MKSGAHKTAGKEARSADTSDGDITGLAGQCPLWVAVVALAVSGASLAQALYKYQDANGDWIYSDRPPADENMPTEVRDLPKGFDAPEVHVTQDLVDEQIRFEASNEFHAPVEVILALDELRNVGMPPAEQPLRWVVPARSDMELLRLTASVGGGLPQVEFRYLYLPGDPLAQHAPDRAYRAPFANAKTHRISQSFPLSITHNTADSRYAIDIAMPIGTDIYAARGGTVVEVASTNYRGGFDTTRDGAEANMIRILHDDGTFGIYAHLNWNSIRVQPGDTVQRGEYIADSGNTGFSTGPHLHFAVVQNKGLRIESVPVVFEGRNSSIVDPETGMELTAY